MLGTLLCLAVALSFAVNTALAAVAYRHGADALSVLTYRTTLAVLRTVFPEKRVSVVRRPMLQPSQTRLFGKGTMPAVTKGEVDLILRPR